MESLSCRYSTVYRHYDRALGLFLQLRDGDDGVVSSKHLVKAGPERSAPMHS